MKTEQIRRKEMFDKIIDIIDGTRFSGQAPVSEEWAHYNAAIDDVIGELRKSEDEIL